MIKGEQLQRYTDFYNSARYNDTLDPRTTLMIHLASSMAMACYPWMEHYLGVAGEMGISDDEIGAVQAIVMAVSGGRVRAQFREVRRRVKVKDLAEDSRKQQESCWRRKGATIMTPDEMRDKAEAYFEKRFHWSQALLAVGQEKLGRDYSEDLIRAIGPFGGGLGRGEVCGAVSGAIAVFGLVFSRGNEEERENLRMWPHVQKFIDRFEREIGRGSIYCRDIAGADWRDLEAVKAFYRSEKLLDCQRLTGETARLLGEFLEGFERGEMTGSRNYFETVAPKWDAMRQGFFSETVREKAFEAAGAVAGKIAADIGAGSGFVTEGLLRRRLRVIAVDRSEAMLEEMRRKFGEDGAVEYRIGEAESLPLADGSVDYVFANMFLHHVESPADAIREMARILKPGGRLVITDLDRHDFEFLRTEHCDRWKGFDRPDVALWFTGAGLPDVRVDCAGENCCAASQSGCGEAAVSIFVAWGMKP